MVLNNILPTLFGLHVLQEYYTNTLFLGGVYKKSTPQGCYTPRPEGGGGEGCITSLRGGFLIHPDLGTVFWLYPTPFKSFHVDFECFSWFP